MKPNAAQQEAIDTINGPVMVLAGPGTGKTQLLASRVANILKQPDIFAENILCLTFTDAASEEMQLRMAREFGTSAYDVAVHTFHSFAVSAMSRYSDYFYDGANYVTADEITKLEIINNILRDLPHDNPLSGTHEGTATYLHKVKSAISAIKRKGAIAPDELRNTMRDNLDFIDFAEPILLKVFSGKMSSKDIGKYRAGYEELLQYKNDKSSLAIEVINDFADAINEATSTEKVSTKSITAFKNATINAKKQVMKDRAKSERILALADVYDDYQATLAKRKLYDFDDMIMQMVDKIENNADFRAELQEQYQYVLVDEFQDTNDAQMRILLALCDDPLSNIMVVGDDDQAIYSFQGANSNNLKTFAKHYPDATYIQLFENYRSNKPILNLAEQVIEHSNTRIKANFFTKIKELLSKGSQTKEEVEMVEAESEIDERSWIAESVAKRLSKHPDESIAIIAREHKDLIALLPYLNQAGIKDINYERKYNVFDSEPVRALEALVRIVVHLGQGSHIKANELMPELLAHDALNIPAKDIWQLSLKARDRNNWLDTMLESSKFSGLANWLISTSKEVQNQPLEDAIDGLFNKYFKSYYFNDDKLKDNPNTYLDHLSDLIALRDKALEYTAASNPALATFIEMIDAHRKYEQPIQSVRLYGHNARVHLLTAHKAKGLEFDTVFVVHGTKNRWLKTKADSFFPSNLHVNLPGSLDENLRLIFVSVTRAKNKLFITAPKRTSTNKENLTIQPYLGNIEVKSITTTSTDPITKLETAWQNKYTTTNSDLKDALAPRLKSYELSASALNSFTNLEYAGPKQFLLKNLLRFPDVRSAGAEYGTAVHETLRAIHGHFNQNSALPDDDEIAEIFTSNLTRLRLATQDFNRFLKRGLDYLPRYVRSADFCTKQQTEQVFHARLGDIRLTGKLDLIVVDEKTKTIDVFDYKTGKVFDKFNKDTTRSHTYYNQLLFYKLLIERSSNRPGYKIGRGVLNFIEAKPGESNTLEIDFSKIDMDEFEQLVTAVWQKIQALEFPDTTDYSETLTGTIKFEQDLIEGSI